MTGSIGGVEDGTPYVDGPNGKTYYLHPNLETALPWILDGAAVEFEVDRDDSVVSMTVSAKTGTVKKVTAGKKAFWTADFDGVSITTWEESDAEEKQQVTERFSTSRERPLF